MSEKFIIWKSLLPLHRGAPYIVVAGGAYAGRIRGEGYLLIVRPGLEPIFVHLDLAQILQETPEFAGILTLQFEAARDQLTRWLIEQTMGEATDVSELEWEKIPEPESLAPILSDQRVLAKFEYILKATNCRDLEQFVSKACDLQELQRMYKAATITD